MGGYLQMKQEKNGEALKGEKHHNAKKVICIETNEIFACIGECAEKMNISYSNLRACCQGRLKTAGGYHFKYYEHYLKEVKNNKCI